MKLVVVGHSLIHIRQINFFKEVARLGRQVTLFCPDRWGEQAQDDYQASVGDSGGMLAVRPLPLAQTLELQAGSPLDRLWFPDLPEELAKLELGPEDWIYIQQEPESRLAHEVAALKLPARKALFTWQNISRPLDHFAYFAALDHYDLVVCGNDGAETRMKHAGAKRTLVLPQVGVDTDHFQARPNVPRDIPVAYIGRPAPEKGVPQLLQAWPAAKILDWVDYRELPWRYSQAQIVVCFSQDTDNWREQAMPFVACEAMACGCAVIVSDAGSIPFWHNTYPGPQDPSPAVVVPQGSVETLGRAIRGLLAKPALRQELADKGRPWVLRNLSSPIIARRLLDAFQ